jgi:hypothetical protein
LLWHPGINLHHMKDSKDLADSSAHSRRQDFRLVHTPLRKEKSRYHRICLLACLLSEPKKPH